MACHGARRLLQMTDNLFGIIGIEAMTAAQGIDFRAPLATSAELTRAIARDPRGGRRRWTPTATWRRPGGGGDAGRLGQAQRGGVARASCRNWQSDMNTVEIVRGIIAGHPRPAAYRHARAAGSLGAAQRERPAARRYRLAHPPPLRGAAARRDAACGRPSTATSSTPIATRRTRASIPDRTRPGWCRLPISTAGRSGRRRDRTDAEIAERLAAVSMRPIMRRLPPRSRGCRRSTASPSSTTATRSARASRSCSTACCRISMSAPMTGRAARREIEEIVVGHRGGERAHACAQRPLQGRLDDAPLWPAAGWRARDPDGACAVDASRERGPALRL